ncbi:MAG: hypothetical protein AAGJ79_04730 [Verrucomicrobiota bacterium]
MATKSKANTNGEPKGQSVDTIRDILFGEQMADYETRFAELEKQLVDKFEELKKDLTNHAEQLTSAIQREREDSEDRNPSRARLADLFDSVADQLRSKSG